MLFEHPAWLAGLMCLPLLVMLLWRANHLRRRACAAMTGPDAGRRGRRVADGRRFAGAALCLLGIALILVAAARPRFGQSLEATVARGADVMVLLDVSRSMSGQDVAPSRLARAQTDIRDLLEQLEGDRVGLIAFAGEAVLACPLSVDHGFFVAALNQLDVDFAPRGGTQIAVALNKALASLEDRTDRDQLIVLITDGEDQNSSLDQVLEQLAQRRIRVIAIGLGDIVEGSRIPVGEPNASNYLTYDGQVVWSKLNEDVLKRVALRTGGAYVPARTRNYDLGQLYQQQFKDLARGELRTEKKKRYQDRFQWFLGAGLACLLIGDLLRQATPKSGAGR